MAVCSETYMAVAGEVQQLRQKLERIETRNADLETALSRFMREAEFKRSVSGTMGHLAGPYEHAKQLLGETDERS